MWPLVRDLWRLLHSWWRRDRIRVSPREGQLLGLAPPCVLVVAGEPAQIVRRNVKARTGAARVVYHCVTRAGHAVLLVRQRLSLIAWRTRDGTRRLHEEDIEVYPAAATPPGAAPTHPPSAR